MLTSAGGAGPVIGITCDLQPHPRSGRMVASAAMAYAACVAEAGGVPILLPPIPSLAREHAGMCHGFVFTGGDDPRMEEFGGSTHPKATVMNAERQRYETSLLRMLEADDTDSAVLGVCLGMQLMSLVAGGRMDQHLPDSLATHAMHYSQDHRVAPEHATAGRSEDYGRVAMPPGVVASHHRQAVVDPGRLHVTARSEDGVIEAVADPARRFWVGVQWHPERTVEPTLGVELFRRLVAACGGPAIGGSTR